MYAKNHENLGHGMCHPLPGFSLDGLLKGLDTIGGLFTKIIWYEILIEFLQKVIQKCTNHFG